MTSIVEVVSSLLASDPTHFFESADSKAVRRLRAKMLLYSSFQYIDSAS